MFSLFLNPQPAPVQVDLTRPGFKRSYGAQPGMIFNVTSTPSPYQVRYGLSDCAIARDGSALFTLTVTNDSKIDLKVPISLDRKAVHSSDHHRRISWVVEAETPGPPRSGGVIQVLDGAREEGEHMLLPGQTIAIRFAETRPTFSIKVGDKLSLKITENRLRDDRYQQEGYSILSGFAAETSASCR